MPKRSIYLDNYHNVLVKHLSIETSISQLISDALDEYMREKWRYISDETYMAIVHELAVKTLTTDLSKIPLYQIRSSVEKCLLVSQQQRKSKQPKN